MVSLAREEGSPDSDAMGRAGCESAALLVEQRERLVAGALERIAL